MLYVYEEPAKLIEKIEDYAMSIKRDGILSLDDKIEKEENQFLKIVLNELLENISPDRLKSYKRFIKYYVKELKCSKKKKYKIKKQLKMIFHSVKLIQEEEPHHQIKAALHKFYPRGFIKIGDYIRTTKEDSSVILYGEVTAIDDSMDVVFFSQLNGGEDLVVSKYQLTDNFGQGNRVKSFVKAFFADNN